MHRLFMDRRGFTFTEIMFVSIISMMVIGAILSVWLFTYQTWTGESERTHLRVDLMKALEMIKSDIRLSSLTYASFCPAGSGPYTAISVPVAETDANGFYALDASGKIDWDKTVIYHLYVDGDGNRSVRRTVFDPRDNTMTEDERYAQLLGVVSSGTGGGGSTTDTGFLPNVDTFEIASMSPIIDFYEDSSSPVRVGRIVIGWAKLSAGDHTFNFEITGKNDLSSGYAIGIDSIMIEPSGSIREVEYYNSAFAPAGAFTVSGGSVSRVYDPIWGNDNYLEFDGGVGDSIEISDYYDLWRESGFANASLNDAKIIEEEVRVTIDVPISDTPPEEAGEINWFAYAQAGDSQQEGRDGDLLNLLKPSAPPTYPVAIRTVVTNDSLDKRGDLVKVKFKSSSQNPLKIEAAYITRRESNDEDGLVNLDPSGLDIEEYHRHQQLFFWDAYDMDGDGDTDDFVEFVYIPANGEVWSKWTAFPLILEDSSGNDVEYLITFYIPDPTGVSWPSGWSFSATNKDCKYWNGSTTNTYYVAEGTGTEILQAAGTPLWNGVYTVESSDNIYMATNMDIWQKGSTIESQIFDTTLSAPAYNEIKWSEYRPTGTDIILKARSSSDQYMTGAPAWDTITGSSSNPHSLSIGNGRYVQFFAELSADAFWETPTLTLSYEDYIDTQATGQPYDFPEASGEPYITGIYSTWIDDVEMNWPGSDRICTVTGYIARKDDYGQAKFTVDGLDLVKVLSVHAKVSEDFRGRTIEEENYVEIQPRNTGK